jgi:predicted cobalt transporter CbtA
MRGYTSVLLRGLLAGLFAGLLAGAFAYAFGEPHIDAAIAIEESAAHSHSHDGANPGANPGAAEGESEEPLVSRDGQRAGLFLATAVYGIALGGIAATALVLLRRRLRTGSDAYAALAVAASGFVGIVLVPFLKYPPNPPAVGDPETITKRTISYLLALVIGLLAIWGGVAAARRVKATPDWLRPAVGAAAFLATVVIGYLLLPSIDEVPADFPATLLWEFRLASLGTQTVLWTLLGFGLAALMSTRERVRV